MSITNIGADSRNFYGLLVNTDGDKYEVPPFQRSYAWDKDQWFDFWSDIIETVKDKGDTIHFMGAMVFLQRREKPSQLWWVLDGQQRMSTLMIFLAALRDAIADLYPEQYEVTRSKIQNLMTPEIPGSFPAEHAHRLVLNKTDSMLFSQIVSGSGIPNVLPKDRQRSERLILKAYNYFLDEHKSELNSGNWKAPNEFFAAIEKSLTHRLCHIRVEIKDQVNAHAVFEALNNRGIELSQADLIKNYLLMEVQDTPDRLKQAEATWEKIVKTVGEDELVMLLRYSWNSAHGFVRMDELQRELAKKVGKNTGDVMQYIDWLIGEASLFAALRKGSGADWIDKPTSDALAALKTLGLRTSYVLLLALCGANQKSLIEKRKAVKDLLSFSVRYYIVGGHSANTMEKHYSEWAIGIRSKTMTSAGLLRELRQRSGTKEEFHGRFVRLNVRDANVAKYLLRGINHEMFQREGTPNETHEALELEHIVPQSLTDYWKSAIGEADPNASPDDLIHRLGNLTLLEKKFNTAGSNLSLAQKREKAYDKSVLPTNRDLKGDAEGAYGSFGPAEILKREQMFASIAERRWSL